MKREFLWGAATSAHQVEGDNAHNDWWEWEQQGAGRVRSGKAAGHYDRFRDDFALAQQLGHNAHRLSIEWSRVESAEGEWNRGAVEHYREVLQELRACGMQSFVTLHHFTNPIWLAREGGWLAPEAPEKFARYAKFVAEQLGDLVDFWVTINEPMVYATQSYWREAWPPQEKNMWHMWRVIRQMARGHKLAYRGIHAARAGAQVGLAKHLVAYLPEHKEEADDRLVAALEDWWFNHFFFRLTGIKNHDFIGVNYYFTRKQRVSFWRLQLKEVPWEGAKSDMGWPIAPDGLTHVLNHMKRYGKPLYVTENGLADADDRQRADFIRSHLRAVEKAQGEGADVRGYLHWSLLDNFEWAEGFEPRFGLIEVDYETMERRVRPSARVYQAIIKQARGL